jgi:uncharacterized protein YjbI with pentapeptide repeats
MCKWKPEKWPFDGEYPGCRHPAYPGHESGYCIFHISLEEKNQNPELAAEFRKKFFDLYKAGTWDFTGFEFPDQFEFGSRVEEDFQAWDFLQGGIREPYIADRAGNEETATFALARFGEGVYFQELDFSSGVSFRGSQFGNKANFSMARFGHGTDFIKSSFGKDADFKEAKFGDRLNFTYARFGEGADFSWGEIGSKADFSFSRFSGLAFFWETSFGDNLSFFKTNFGDYCCFCQAKFGARASFAGADFGEESAEFISARFGGGAGFMGAKFIGFATFENAIFEGGVSFEDLEGEERIHQAKQPPKDDTLPASSEVFSECPPHMYFGKTQFRGPALFRYNDLSHTIFEQAELSNLSFLYSKLTHTQFWVCTWGRGAENSKYWLRRQAKGIRFRRPRLLFDELLLRKKQIKEGNSCPWPPEHKPEAVQYIDPLDDLGPGGIEVLALQLKQSLEATRDPIAAGDFHFCAMEMKREQAWEQGRAARATVLWLYKMVSGYGERYGRTLMWLGWLVGIATTVYMTNGGFSPAANAGQAGAVIGFWDYLLYAAQNVLPFKFSQLYIQPITNLSRWASFIETFIGTTLFTFFVLALRRRFKR